MNMEPDETARAVGAALTGDSSAFARLVEATQDMAFAVAFRIPQEDASARDAVQDAYVSAFRRLPELSDVKAFAGWLRRIVIAGSLNQRRRTRTTWISLDEALVIPPVLDEEERLWSEGQHRQLARALLTLSDADRRLCELHYHGRRSAERLALDAEVEPAAMRKRLQRIRDKLRKEIEMDERAMIGSHPVPLDMPANISALLARPRLVHLPDNPVAAVSTTMREAFNGFSEIELSEEVDLTGAQHRLGGDAVYIDRSKLQRIDAERVLRYDLTLPLLLNVSWRGSPQRLYAAGKAYRRETESATHLEAFHQLEMFAIDARDALETWDFAGRILNAVDRVLPRSEVPGYPHGLPDVYASLELGVLRAGEWVEVLAWGEYADWVLRGIGADPGQQRALGAGIGLERMASIKYDIDDIRKIANASLSTA